MNRATLFPNCGQKPVLRWLGRLLLSLGMVGLAVAPAGAQEKAGAARDKAGREGLFITVLSPITEGVVDQIKDKVHNAITRQKLPVRTIVFDFNPNGQAAATEEITICDRLKRFIDGLEKKTIDKKYESIQTFAFVHGTVSRHTVLPVLACSQIIMSKDSTLGPIPEDEPLTKADKSLYLETAAERNRSREAVQQLLQSKRVSTTEAREEYHLCDGICETKEDLRLRLNLPARSLREDWLAGRQVVPWVIELNGPPNRGSLDSLNRRINTAIGKGANLIILKLNSEGGEDTTDLGTMAEKLTKRKDRSGSMPVKFIAYVPPGKALGSATYLALGCSEIVMGTGAALGDFAYLKSRTPGDLKVKGEALARLASKNGYPGALFRATIDPDVVVYRVEPQDRPGEVAFVTEQEWERDQNNVPPRWKVDAVWKTRVQKNNDGFVKISGDLLAKSGVVDRERDTVDTPRDLYKLYNLNPDRVTVSRDDWLDHIAEFFREPWVRILLLLIGITGLILEIKMPGVSIPGIIAALCFVLFFWSYSFVSDYTALAVLLFLLGLVLLGLEIFVFPSFGALGVSGIILLVVSLLLVTLEKMPESPEEWEGLGWTLGSYLVSVLGAIVVAVAIASFLPQIPYANRLMLIPPGDGDNDHGTLAATEANAALLGAIGITETPLRPAGKARFADDYIDVISQGDYITPGSRVQVIEIEGNRIVVKQV